MIRTPKTVLPDFLETVCGGGGAAISSSMPARPGCKGLSPKENREIPPLDYDLVLRMKAAFPQLTICINGGITSLDAGARRCWRRGLTG